MISVFARDMLRLLQSPSSFHYSKNWLHRSHVHTGPVTWYGLLFRVFGSHFLDESQIRWSSFWEWYCSPPRTESREYQSKISELPEFGTILRTSTPVASKTLPEVCSPLPDASCGDLTETFDRFKWSRTAGARSCATCTSAIACARVRAGTSWSRRHHRLRILVYPPMCNSSKNVSVTREERSCEGTHSATMSPKPFLFCFSSV